MTQHTIALNDDTYSKAKVKAKASNLSIGSYIALLIEQSEGVEVVWRNQPKTPKTQEVSLSSLGIRHS